MTDEFFKVDSSYERSSLDYRLNFHRIGLGNTVVIYQKTPWRMAWKSFVEACNRDAACLVSYGSNTRSEKWITRERDRPSELFPFFFFFLPPCIPRFFHVSSTRLFVRCLKVSALVSLKALNKKESFAIMVILQVVKRNTQKKRER